MQLHQLRPIHKLKKGKRVGRGGKRGTYSGRGVKGQKSRAGRKLVPIIRQLIKRYPKLRGYKFKSKRAKPEVINLEILEKKFRDSEIVTPKVLLEKRLIRRIKGRVPQVKILSKGKLSKKLSFEKCQVSKQAKEKIEKAGGKIER
jgi:large subunit ribosomal protein L15